MRAESPNWSGTKFWRVARGPVYLDQRVGGRRSGQIQDREPDCRGPYSH